MRNQPSKKSKTLTFSYANEGQLVYNDDRKVVGLVDKLIFLLQKIKALSFLAE